MRPSCPLPDSAPVPFARLPSRIALPPPSPSRPCAAARVKIMPQMETRAGLARRSSALALAINFFRCSDICSDGSHLAKQPVPLSQSTPTHDHRWSLRSPEPPSNNVQYPVRRYSTVLDVPPSSPSKLEDVQVDREHVGEHNNLASPGSDAALTAGPLSCANLRRRPTHNILLLSFSILLANLAKQKQVYRYSMMLLWEAAALMPRRHLSNRALWVGRRATEGVDLTPPPMGEFLRGGWLGGRLDAF